MEPARRPCLRLAGPALVVIASLVGLPGDAHSQAPAPADVAALERLAPLLEFVRARTARDYALTSPAAIDEGRYIRAGEIEQWVTARGEDRANPVLLLLHGGPGDATNPWGYAGLRAWTKAFTVVQWDQRGAGKTLGRSGPTVAPTISVDRLAQDGVEIAEAVRTWLGKDKLVLVGHSWGSILGARMAKARPELFHAFVGTGQVGDPQRGYHVAFDALLAHAKLVGETRAVRELEEVGPPPYADGRGYQVQRRWSNLFEGADAFIASMMGFALRAPGGTLGDVNDWFQGQVVSAERLVPETSKMTASAIAGRFALPVYVIQGERDFTTPTSLARGFIDASEAPAKRFVTIDGGHFAVFMHPEAFLRELRAVVGVVK
jgi:pimeloyl-ACP methyl ester carboxylesterase